MGSIQRLGRATERIDITNPCRVIFGKLSLRARLGSDANPNSYNGGIAGTPYEEMPEYRTEVTADDAGTDRCCTICYQARNCIFYRKFSTTCRVFISTPSSPNGVSETCPKGVPSGWVFSGINPSPAYTAPLGKGPCFPGN